MASGPVRPFPLAAGFLAATAAGLLGYMLLHVRPLFEQQTGLSLPDFRLNGYEAADVQALAGVLARMPEAAGLYRMMHLVPDMIFPAAYAALCTMLLMRYAAGATVFHKPLRGIRFGLVVAVPLVYALFDYAENAASLAVFPPASPSAAATQLLSTLLPFATRAKGLFFFVALILVLRFTLFREQAPAAQGSREHEETGA